MNARTEPKGLAGMILVFAASSFLPLGSPRSSTALTESLASTKWTMHAHLVLCLLPAFWIAGARGAFDSKQAVIRYFGPDSPKALSHRARLAPRRRALVVLATFIGRGYGTFSI